MESLAITHAPNKLAALLFDHALPMSVMPDFDSHYAVTCPGAETHHRDYAMAAGLWRESPVNPDLFPRDDGLGFERFIAELVDENATVIDSCREFGGTNRVVQRLNLRAQLYSLYLSDKGVPATVVLNREHSESVDFFSSALERHAPEVNESRSQLENNTIKVAISNFPMIDTSNLEWSQVMEIRKDPTTKIKLQRFRTFYGDNYQGKSAQYISDSIAVKMDDYKRTVKEQGLDIIHTGVEVLVNSKTALATAVLALCGAYTGAAPKEVLAVSGAIMVGSGLSLAISQKLREQARFKQQHELAYLIELQKKIDAN